MLEKPVREEQVLKLPPARVFGNGCQDVWMVSLLGVRVNPP